jgi:hypothetical protein
MDDGDVEAWMTVGTGLMHEKVRAHEQEVPVEGREMDEQWSDWAKILSPEYVEYVQEQEFNVFFCPVCNDSI